jgi:hypothetical protein
MSDAPDPPFLVLRPGISFWVEREAHAEMRATLQALRDGCFEGAQCIDGSGGLCPVLAAAADRSTIVYRIVPWKRVRVSVRLGPRSEIGLSDLVEALNGALESTTGFRDHLGVQPSELARRLRACGSIAQVIRVVDPAGG